MNNLVSIGVSDSSSSKISTVNKKIKHKRKHKKRSKSRKKSDPCITSISQLLSASLSFISPDKNAKISDKSSPDIVDTSLDKSNLIRTNGINEDNEKEKEENKDEKIKNSAIVLDNIETVRTNNLESESIIDLEDMLDTPTKQNVKRQSKNAFEFMMESSKKSIGRNSPGKDIEKQEDTTQSKEKLAARKALMEQWAFTKGCKKRKIKEDKERDECIKYKLDIRAKRMKNMLSIEDSTIKKKRKRVKKVSSDSEDSQDCFINENEGNKSINALVINLEHDAKMKTTSNLQQKHLDKFLGLSPSTDVEKEKIDEVTICELDDDECGKRENAIKIKMFSPKVFKRRKNISKDTENYSLNMENAVNDKEEKENLEKSKKTKKNKKKINIDLTSNIDRLRSKNNTISECIKLVVESDGNSNESICLVENEETNKNGLRRSRRSRRCNNIYVNSDYLIDSDGEQSDDSLNGRNAKSKRDKVVKLAPIFLPNKVKPKIDPLVLEARRNFLMSGIPDALKRTVEKQQGVDVIEPDFFPEISHIQQKTTMDNEFDFWRLPQVDIPTIDLNIPLPELGNIMKGTLNKFEGCDWKGIDYHPPKQIKNLKSILLEIKKNNPDYPVFRSYRLLKMKTYKHDEECAVKEKAPAKKKRGRKRKSVEPEKTIEPQIDKSNFFTMWTEKYKANKYEDLIGNHGSTLELKKWLQGWLSVRDNSSKIITQRESSSSDFDCDDGSRDSTMYPRSTIILYGPHGSGKTMAVYAICNELGINVLELNASSKRTGKRLVQELQEATQSHQVRKSETLDLNTFFKPTNTKKLQIASKTNESQNNTSKMCLLLVEDIDVVFEQDEGFLPALTQLISNSKRPIVLVATDISSPNLQKIISQNTTIQFTSLSSKTMSVWLQILCLLEGCFVNKESVDELLQCNGGDVRKTLLELQFWVQSGGGNTIEKTVRNLSDVKINSEDNIQGDNSQLVVQDEQIVENDLEPILMHAGCVNNFTNQNCITLEKFWWNLPKCSILPPVHQRKKLIKTEMSSERFKNNEILNLSQCLDAMSEIDKNYIKFNIIEDNNLTVKNGRFEIKDSIELNEADINCNGKDFAKEWAQSLFLGYMNEYKNSEQASLDLGLPNMAEQRWQNKQKTCKVKYMDVAPLTCHVDKRSFVLDYFPTLRTITRSELTRSANSQKRKNRFVSYLRTLGFTCGDKISTTACHMLDCTFKHNET